MFTKVFESTPLTDRPQLVEEERQRRCIADPGAYVAVPVIVPKMSSVVQGVPADYELFWLVGLPGPLEHPRHPGKMAREAINFQCAREETADDMVYMLNQARLMREMQCNIKESMEGQLAEQAQLQDEQNPADQVADALTVG